MTEFEDHSIWFLQINQELLCLGSGCAAVLSRRHVRSHPQLCVSAATPVPLHEASRTDGVLLRAR